jgi:ATP-dependent Lhr-like helicase
MPLHPQIVDWFRTKGWSPRQHQLDVLETTEAGASALLIAPTGAGKTLAGFLPTINDLIETPREGLHTLYLSPLKALAVDVQRNLMTPVTEMGLKIKVEARTGDTPAHRRQRQRVDPPQILLTTPEQLALLLSHADSAKLFAGLKRIVIDELHAMVTSKRGELLSLGLARLGTLAPQVRITALSATVAHPELLRDWIATPVPNAEARLLLGQGGARPDIGIIHSEERIPWAGHSAAYAIPDLYKVIKEHKTTLLFVNTRSQAELLFQLLWQANDEDLPIAMHHGSLAVEQRRKVEAAMADGRLRAVVCTSTLDLGIDWGDVDLVVQVGAPKGASRMLQRIGRANHRLDEPSKALLVPSNRFEVLECEAAVEAVQHNWQDSEDPVSGGLDVLAQHVLGTACADAFDPVALYDEIRRAWPYRALEWEQFERVVDFVATGGYALRAYERYAKLRQMPDGKFRIANPGVAQQYRLNIGTIVEEAMVKVRLVRGRMTKNAATGPIGRSGRVLGEMEEYFFTTLTKGDTFLFGAEVVAYEGMFENEAYVSRAHSTDPKIPSYTGGKFPLSTFLADGVRKLLAHPDEWHLLPEQVADWLRLQRDASLLPEPDSLLVETFPRGAQNFLVCYPFEGRLAHQTLGMLLTRRLERARARPLGFVASDYSLAIWGLGDFSGLIRTGRLSLDDLFDEDMLGDDLEAWLDESALMRRTFRNCAIIAGLIERRHPGQKEKTGRQITVSSDIIYDVLYQHEPDHILIQATRRDAARGLLDIERLGHMLARIRQHIVHKPLDRISPLAVPILLDIGKEKVSGEARESAMVDAAAELIREATGQL